MTDADQVERDADQRRRENTLLARAQADADEVGGRFAKLTPTVVVGISPSPYPPLPEGSWMADPVPPEPPLNEDINAVPPDAT
jgi:hypothetical protein